MSTLPGRKILLVDDDASLRRALARALRLAGHTVETFGTADELIRSGVDGAAACLVLDINLSGTSGVDFRLALAAAGREPPTIFITALDRDDADAALARIEAPVVLFKPFGNAEFLAAVAGALRVDAALPAAPCAP